MTIQELYDFLGKFIKKHPECKDQKIMVKNLKDESTWEEVTKKYIEKMKKLEGQEDDYDYYL